MMLAINVELMPKIKLMGFVSYKQPWIHFKRTTHECILYFIKSGELHLRENGIDYILKKGISSFWSRMWSMKERRGMFAITITFTSNTPI